MTAVIRWEDPPPTNARWTGGSSGPRSKYAPLAEQLRAHPGRWALVREVDRQSDAAGFASLIRFGRTICFEPRGDFDACTRAVDGRFRVYARYLGNGGHDA